MRLKTMLFSVCLLALPTFAFAGSDSAPKSVCTSLDTAANFPKAGSAQFNLYLNDVNVKQYHYWYNGPSKESQKTALDADIAKLESAGVCVYLGASTNQ